MGLHQDHQSTTPSVISATTVRKEQRKSICNATIWLKSGANETAQKAIAKSLYSLEGVSRVNYIQQKPCIMMVEYCTKNLTSSALISAVNIHGGIGRIIGC